MNSIPEKSPKNRRFQQKRRRHNACQFGAGFVFIATTLSSGVALALTDSEKQQQFNQIDEGFRLFTAETFGGNGRTCSTCHIPKENYNIFPSSIKNMTDAQKALVFGSNVPGLENIDLINSHALFNISGNALTHRADELDLFGTADHTGPVFRSSMRIAAAEITATNASANFPGSPLLPSLCSQGAAAGLLKQLGWSGDAPPGSTVDDDDCHTHHGNFDSLADGSIRAFANGAIAQHNTKSLNRVAGLDFRFATATEADALGAFQSWLGRRPLSEAENAAQGTTGRIEFDITLLNFVDDRIDLGRDHYAAPAEFTRNPAAGALISVSAPTASSGAGCNACHTNGGANTGILGVSGGVGGLPNRGQNTNINTDVEHGSDDIAVEVFGPGFVLPHDEGASDSFGPRPAAGPAFEDSFNIQSVIEAPNKKAWFHNHRVLDNFENAVAFYITQDFRRTDDSDPNGDGNNGDFTGFVGTDLLGAAFTSDEVMKFGNAIKGLGAISFPNGDGIEHVGAFLRALSAYYSLRDCERLVAEMKERIEVAERLKGKVKIDVPREHAKFALADAQNVISGAKLTPVPYADLIAVLKAIDKNINNVQPLLAKKKNTDAKTLLDSIGTSLKAARESIAVTPAT